MKSFEAGPALETPKEDRSEQEKKPRTGKLSRLAMAAAFISGLAGGTMGEARADAGPAHAEKQQKKEEPINEKNLTESGKWSRGMIEAAKADMKCVHTHDEAEALLRRYFNPFVGEYYLPTKGDVRDIGDGMKSRHYSDDDLRLLRLEAMEMKKLIDDLHKSFVLNEHTSCMETIDRMIKRIEDDASPIGKQRRAILEHLDDDRH